MSNLIRLVGIVILLSIAAHPLQAAPLYESKVSLAPNFQLYAEDFARFIENRDAGRISQLIGRHELWDPYLEQYVLGDQQGSFRSIIGSDYSILVHAWRTQRWHADFFIVTNTFVSKVGSLSIKDLPKNEANKMYVACRVVQSIDGARIDMDGNLCFLETDALEED